MNGTSNNLALAAPPQAPSASSDLPTALSPSHRVALAELQAAKNKMEPASRDDFAKQLTACLVLVQPASWGDADRDAWLNIAWHATRHLPADLLRLGCGAARRKADHHSKIVAIINDEVSALLSSRRRHVAEAAQRAANEARRAAISANHKPDYCTGEEAAAILDEFGLRSTATPKRKQHYGEPKQPTAADLEEIRKELGL